MAGGLGLALVLSTLPLSGTARAADTKKKDVKGTATPLGKKQQSQSGPDSSLAGDVRRKKVKEEYGPQVEYDAFRFQIELQVADKRRAQMETLEKIIALGASEREMPDLIFRDAELCWEESRYFFFEANRRDDTWMAAKQKGDAAGMQQALAEKEDLLKKSASFQAEAILRYRQIVKKYPAYPRMDEVLYFLGHNLWDDNKEKDALGIYKLLVQRYPQSKYVADAYLAFGEYYFNNSKGQRPELLKALSAYKKSASFPENKVYLYALYKEGWCYYNLADFPQALEMFKSVILYADIASSTSSGNKLRLARDARRDYVLAYSRYGNPLAAKDDFQKVGGVDNWWAMLKGLAGLYYDDGNDKASVLVYRQLIRERPLSPEAPFFQGRIVDAAMRVGIKKITAAQARLLVQILQDVEKSGVAKSDADKKMLLDARDLAERTLSNLAVSWHNEGKKTRDDETFAMANEAYVDYLTIFPAGHKSYDLHFYHGELLFDNLQRYREAADEYTWVVDADIARLKQGQKPGRWFAKALEDAVYAWEEVVKAAEAAEPKTAVAKSGQPLTVPPEQQGLLTACENYVQYLPKGDKEVEANYKAAEIYYKYNHFPEAVKLFAALVAGHPESSLAVPSANLILDSYNLTGDYQAVHDWAKRFLASPKLARGKTKEEVEFRDNLPRILEESAFKLVEQLERKGEYELAAARFVSFVTEFPKNTHADQALWNASIDYYKAGAYASAIETRKRLIAEYPQSKFTPKALLANAEAYEGHAEFGAAAQSYERYAEGYERQIGIVAKPTRSKRGAAGKTPKKLEPPPEVPAEDRYESGQTQTALINAAVYRVGLREYAEALKDRETYLRLWPVSKTHNQGDSQSEKVFASIADVYEAMGKTQLAIAQLEEHQLHVEHDLSAVIAIQYRLAKLYAQAHNQKMARRLYDEIWKEGSRVSRKRLSPEALEGLAQASYVMNEDIFDQFENLKLHLPEAQLVKDVKAKGQMLLRVQKAYTETVQLQSAEPGICALWRIGLAYQLFAQSLNDAPVPANMRQNEQLVQAYKEALAQQAMPVEQKAKEAYQSALAKAHELGVYNECSAKALEGLRRYDPVSYGEVAEILAPSPTGGFWHPEPVGLITAVPATKSPPVHQPVTVPSAPTEEKAETPAPPPAAKAPIAASAETSAAAPEPKAVAPVDLGPATARDFPTEADRPKPPAPKPPPPAAPTTDPAEPKE
jgi:cellulose synthase operon protein C